MQKLYRHRQTQALYKGEAYVNLYGAPPCAQQQAHAFAGYGCSLEIRGLYLVEYFQLRPTGGVATVTLGGITRCAVC